MIKKVIKNILPLRRLKDLIYATTYFNSKYFEIIKWSFTSREDTNYTYNLSEKNYNELYKLLESIFQIDYNSIKEYSFELLNDLEFKKFIENEISNSPFKKFSDVEIKYGRRIGWYIICRIIKPKIIIETGVDKGLGSLILSKALIENKKDGYDGKYFGTDINPNAGFLYQGEYSKVGEILYGDSITSLQNFKNDIDLFINDSDHSAVYEKNEYKTILDKLSKKSVILGDNSHSTSELLDFSIENKRNFVLFRETPINHWYPGAGIGISYKSN